MLVKKVFSSNFSTLRGFSSLSSHMLKVGDILREARTFSGEDVLQYSKVSHDHNPLHFDSHSAQSAGFEDRVVHGMLVASLFPCIISSHFCKWKIKISGPRAVSLLTSPGAIYVSQSLHFRLPVYIGDKIVAEVQAVTLRGNKNKYIAKLLTKCFKNGEVLVLDGEATAILPSLEVEEARSV